MITHCDDLDPFFDQELPPAHAQAFRAHLASCPRCQKVLRGRMLEAMVVMDAPAAAAPPPPRPGTAPEPAVAAPAPTSQPEAPNHHPAARWRWPFIGGSGALAALVAVVAVRVLLSPSSPEPPRVIQLAAERSLEVRFSAPALDHHRPYGVVRALGAALSSERIPLTDLAELERRSDLNALIAAFALNGDLASAERTARELAIGATSLSDRAAIELLRSELVVDRGAPPTLNVGAARALSLATDALRRDPAHPLVQAKWNQALALERLGLSLAAARRFDEIAAPDEPGWVNEAKAKAQHLRDGYRRDSENWSRIKADADRMILGGPVLSSDEIRTGPSLARDAFYQALATTATPARIDELAQLARALDAQFATTALGDLIARVRASDLAARAPLAAELKAFMELHKAAGALDDLRVRATRRGFTDLVLATFLMIGENSAKAADLPLLDKLLVGNRDPWWTLIQLARRAWVSNFGRREYSVVDAIERQAAPLCRTTRAAWCWRITRVAGGANSQMGRADRGIELIVGSLRQAKAAGAWRDEVDALWALGQAIVIRATDEFDAAAVGGAFLEEVTLRKPSCAARLQRFDVVANAALLYHRFDEAARARAEAAQLEAGECHSEDLRLNAETVTLRLVLRGRLNLDTLRANLATLEAELGYQHNLYLDFLKSGATLAEDRERGELALREVVAAATANPQKAYASLARTSAFDALAESTAGAGGAKAVLALLTERLGTDRFERCVLGLASWSRLVVALLDAEGAPALETREVPEGVLMIPASDVVSPAMRARLAGCHRVDVLTSGAYFGAARLLGDEVAWAYHTGRPRPYHAAATRHELVVSDVTPPEDLRLPALQSLPAPNDATVLSGPRATPESVLAAMKTANLVVIVAHGLTDANEPTAASLILSPDTQGDYLLTASKVSATQLTGTPIVVLAGCDAGRVQVSVEPWSLATSFLAAGARVVIAPTEPIPDASANEVFRSLVERIRAGADPADALVAERGARAAGAPWLSSIVVFE